MTHRSSSVACSPQWATPRSPDRKTLGGAAAAVAEQFGTPFMPWQQQVADVALELDPKTGNFVYREVGLTVPRQSGKDLDCRTPILTAGGWKTMGTVTVGDLVYGPDGKPTAVTFASEVFADHPCYEVEFQDGTVITAGEDHLWRVWDKDGHDAAAWAATGGDRKAAKGSWRTLSTAEIAASRVSKRRADTERMEYRYRVRCDAAIDAPEADLPIDPYIFGYWLGDGTSAASSLTVGAEDRAHVLAGIARAGYRVVSETEQRTGAWGIHFNMPGCGPGRGRDGISRRLRTLKVLGNKHIPECYLTASAAQRRALLAGLLDSDGTIGGQAKTPRVEICACRERLARDIFLLARSLGARTRFLSAPAMYYGKHVGTRWRIAWTPTSNPFRLERKAARWRAPVSDRQKWMSIVDVRPTATVPTRCIQVEHPEHVFLVGETFIPTHNTTLLLAKIFTRALAATRQNIRYTAQTGADARKKLIDDWLPVVEASPFYKRGLFKTRLTNGHEALKFRNGSHVGLVATTKKSGHGGTIDDATLDEAFAHPDARLEQALRPAMITRTHPGPQLWVVSTAGTPEDSPYLWDKVQKYRQVVEANLTHSVCYFEWSAPDDLDPSDPDTWWQCMPALGYTQTVEAIQSEYEGMTLNDFERAFLNRWKNATSDPVIPLTDWNALKDAGSEMIDPVCLAFDVTPDGTRSSISAAGHRADGLLHVEVVETGEGTGWLPKRLAELVEKWKPVALVCDPAGTAGGVLPKLGDLDVTPVTAREHAQACSLLKDTVAQEGLRHLGTTELAVALDGAVKRSLADAWAWSRKSSSIDISPLVAVTLALWGLQTQRQDVPEVYDLNEIIERLQRERAGESEEPEQPEPDRAGDPANFVRLEDLPPGFRP
jgi:hypothetical protein